MNAGSVRALCLAQLVERDLFKLEVTGLNLVARFSFIGELGFDAANVLVTQLPPENHRGKI